MRFISCYHIMFFIIWVSGMGLPLNQSFFFFSGHSKLFNVEISQQNDIHISTVINYELD